MLVNFGVMTFVVLFVVLLTPGVASEEAGAQAEDPGADLQLCRFA